MELIDKLGVQSLRSGAILQKKEWYLMTAVTTNI